MTDRMGIGMGTAATIDRAITRGIEATAPTEIVRTDIVRTDTDRTDIAPTDTDPIEADMDIIAAPADIGASVSDVPAGRMVVPAMDFRFITVIDSFSPPKASLHPT